MSNELTMIGIATLLAVGILLHHPSKNLGLPSLLIFMGVGLCFGNGEFNFVYNNFELSSLVGTISLNVIVFVGGLNTSSNDVNLAWKEGGILSTFGVLLTTIFFALLIYYLIKLDFVTCLLFASIVSSTDAAAVFAILKSKKLKLKENTDTILEFESATNDPIALLLVILLTSFVMHTAGTKIDLQSIISILSTQIFIGCFIGYIVGKLCILALNYTKLDEYGLIPVFVLASFIIATFGTDLLGGNVLITSYILGLIIGNQLKHGAEITKHFYNGISWLAQSLMFILLGLQIFPQTLLSVFYISLLPSLLLILVARPLAVQICYIPFRKASWQKRFFLSSIGLKGASPIVFSLIPALAGVPHSTEMIHMVFFIVFFSILIQGTILAPLAKKLDLTIEEN